MKKTCTLIAAFLVLITANVVAQTGFTEMKAGHTFKISIPNYMTKTSGLNSSASIQFKNSDKDIYGIVIVDTKEELKLAEMPFVDASDFYDGFIKDFLVGEKNRKVSTPIKKSEGGINFVQSDVSYYDKEAKVNMYFFIGIVETGNAYYKVMCWCTLDNKDKFKADFEKIMLSVND